MNQFLLSILASVLGGFLLLVTAGLLSRRVKWLLTKILGHLLDVDIDYVYPSRTAANDDIISELKRAKRVDIFTSRGNELMLETFASVLGKKPERRRLELRILLPNANAKPGATNWVEKREKELASFDPAFGGGLLQRQIEAVVQFLGKYIEGEHLQLRRYRYPQFGRLIITDRVVFLNPYRRDAYGRDTKTIKFRRGGAMYDMLSRLFEDLWSDSEEPRAQS